MTWENDPIVTAAWERDPVVARPAPAPGPAIVLGAGQPVPAFLGQRAGPNSAGYFPLGRRYSVGDNATYQELDGFTNLPRRSFTWEVTKVDEEADRVEINTGAIITDTMGNYLRARTDFLGVPRQFTPAELFVGKKWTAAFRSKAGDVVRRHSFDFHIRVRERLVVPAGEFNAFRVEGRGLLLGIGDGPLRPGSSWVATSFEDTAWYVPGLNFFLKYERIARNPQPQAQIMEWFRRELVSLKQLAVGEGIRT